ncbi:YqcC family protein [Vibrio genomosp. F10]|uniref:YqcC family protein n=1 Tax=Vibrio genomosp. F10 TaxID=723171 RepID=UPI0002F77450|nr:YqcC family protein [Vibrio genomosp. F10]OEF05875.1 pseudouridine synthase [Vibrio genomosp. F10 str. 9ZB36]
MTQSVQLLTLLDELQQELEKKQLWQSHQPDQHALQSQEPFALDTLNPEQWLQWIFIPKIQSMIAQRQPLPVGFAISPYFEQVWKDQSAYQSVVLITTKIDEVCKPC